MVSKRIKKETTKKISKINTPKHIKRGGACTEFAEDSVTELHLDKSIIVDNKESDLSPIEQISVLMKDVVPSLSMKDDVVFSTDEKKTYEFWKDCRILKKYMTSQYNVLLVTPGTVLFRGVKNTCNDEHAPHSTQNIYQQQASWYSDYQVAERYGNNVWCYTPVRPLVLFELTDISNVIQLHNIIFDKMEAQEKLIDYYKKSKEYLLKSEWDNLMKCVMKIDENTMYVRNAILECRNLEGNANTTCLAKYRNIFDDLISDAQILAEKYSQSLTCLSAATGVGVTIGEQLQCLRNPSLNITHMTKFRCCDSNGVHIDYNPRTLNRVSETSNDVILTDIIREYLPWCDGYFGRRVRSTYHDVFHREICIFGSHGKLKLIRKLSSCVSSISGGSDVFNVSNVSNVSRYKRNATLKKVAPPKNVSFALPINQQPTKSVYINKGLQELQETDHNSMSYNDVNQGIILRHFQQSYFCKKTQVMSFYHKRINDPKPLPIGGKSKRLS